MESECGVSLESKEAPPKKKRSAKSNTLQMRAGVCISCRISLVVKCVRNSVVKTGLEIREGRVRTDVLKEAWKRDNSVVRLQAMPHV